MFIISGFYDGASVLQLSIDQIAAVHLGATMTPAQVVSFSARLNAYMTAVGANVY
jgi:hypothetical protein